MNVLTDHIAHIPCKLCITACVSPSQTVLFGTDNNLKPLENNLRALSNTTDAKIKNDDVSIGCSIKLPPINTPTNTHASPFLLFQCYQRHPHRSQKCRRSWYILGRKKNGWMSGQIRTEPQKSRSKRHEFNLCKQH